MDNVAPTVIGDIQVGGETRKAIYYGSKSSLTFILDRTNGKPITGRDEVPIATDSRQAQPRHAEDPDDRQLADPVHPVREARHRQHPRQSVARRAELQRLSSRCGTAIWSTPEPNYLDVDKPFLTIPPGYVGTTRADQLRPHRLGCLYDPQFDFPVLSTTTQNGGNDFSGQSFVQHRNMYVIPWAYANVAHYRSAGSNGLRAPGEYKGGGILALDATTGQVLWDNWDKTGSASTWRTGRPRSRRRRISCSWAGTTVTSSPWTS